MYVSTDLKEEEKYSIMNSKMKKLIKQNKI